MSNEPDEVNNGALATIIVIVALATLGIALVVTSLVREETAALSAEKEVATPQDGEYRQLKATQLAEINAAPAWRDREKGMVSIPIDRAMELVAESIRTNPFNLSPGNNPPEEEETEESSEAEPGVEVEPGSELEANPEGASGDEPTAREKAMVENKSPVEEDPQTKSTAPKTPGAKEKPVPGPKGSSAPPKKPAPAPAPTKPAPTKPAPTKPAPAPAPAP